MQRAPVVLHVPLPDWLYHRLRKIKMERERRRAEQGRVRTLIGDRDIEWSWIAAHMPPAPGEALDFGNGGAAMGLIAAMRGFNVTALDLNEVTWHYHHPRLRFLQGDVLTVDLAAQSLDLVINCSTVEHVGVSGRYSVTQEQTSGDLEAMARLRECLKPGGVMLLTIPLGRDRVFAPYHRVYGRERLPRLIEGFELVTQEFWAKDGGNRWIPASRDAAVDFPVPEGPWDPASSVYALGCFELRRPGPPSAQGPRGEPQSSV